MRELILVLVSMYGFYEVGEAIKKTKKGSWSFFYIMVLLPIIFMATNNYAFLVFAVGTIYIIMISFRFEREIMKVSTHIVLGSAFIISLIGMFTKYFFFFAVVGRGVSLFPMMVNLWRNPEIAKHHRKNSFLFAIPVAIGTDWANITVLKAMPFVFSLIYLAICLRGGKNK